jgi:hypothetical protein
MPGKQAAANMVFKLLSLKMIFDQYNYDDIAIGFNPAMTTLYNYQYDSRYLKGINALEGLSSLSVDGVPLSVNLVPLPKQTPLVIRLDVEAQSSRIFTLERTELDSLSPIYEVWLMDKYKKDSLDLRANTSYTFLIDKKDSSSFGSNRFSIVIREDPMLQVHLLSFGAVREASAAKITWTTENEENYTRFAVERSIDGSSSFFDLDTLTADALGNYAFEDKSTINGLDFYRLKVTDLNGVVSYSNVLTLTFGSAALANSNISIYPNPSNGIINLEISPGGASQTQDPAQSLAAVSAVRVASYGIKIININGSIIKTASSASPTWQENMANLAPGTYFIVVVNSNDNSLIGKSSFIKF